MTLDKIKQLLENATGIKVAYYQYSEQKTPPYLVYFVTSETQNGSDLKNLLTYQTIRVELYTSFKDFDIENKIDNALNFIAFEKQTTFISEEQLYQTSWEFENIVKRNEV